MPASKASVSLVPTLGARVSAVRSSVAPVAMDGDPCASARGVGASCLSSLKKPEMRSVVATAVSAWAMPASAGDTASRVAAELPRMIWRTR